MDFIYWLEDVFISLSDWLEEFANEAITGITEISDEVTQILHNLNTLLQTFQIYMWVSGIAIAILLIMLICVLSNQSKMRKQLEETNSKLNMLIPEDNIQEEQVED